MKCLEEFRRTVVHELANRALSIPIWGTARLSSRHMPDLIRIATHVRDTVAIHFQATVTILSSLNCIISGTKNAL